jgi:hypothetical protein
VAYQEIFMGDNFRDAGKETATRTNPPVGDGGVHPGTQLASPQLVNWDAEPSKSRTAKATEGRESPIKQADAPSPGADKPQPGYLTVNYDSDKGLDKPIGAEVVHLTINSPHGINLATNLIYGKDIDPHFKTVVGEPDATKGVVLKGEFDIPSGLQDITLHYTDAKGLVHNQTYPASQLRLEGTANAVNPYVNDFRKPDPQRPVSAQYPDTTNIYEFGYRLSDISGKALGFLEGQLVNEKAYIDINLAEARVGLAMKHYMNAFGPYDEPTRAREKQYAQTEIAEAKKNYDSAITLAQKQMQTLPNPGDLRPRNYMKPLERRFAPQAYGEDYMPLVYGSAIDTANWRRIQLNVLEGMMSVNGQLPPRQSKKLDHP